MATHQLVRYKQGKNNLELMVVPGTVMKYRKGEVGVDAVLVSDVIFKNQSNGDRANATDIA
jgi:ribosome maturation protein Sdo1